jgi:hypothetical protein
VIGCWYRYYLAIPPKRTPATAVRIERLCRGLAGLQREGCIAAASLISNPDPFAQFRICSYLEGVDVDSCLRGVGTQNLPDAFASGLELIAHCGSLAKPARAGCYSWFGRTLTVLTDGRFAKQGCRRLTSRARPSLARSCHLRFSSLRRRASCRIAIARSSRWSFRQLS